MFHLKIILKNLQLFIFISVIRRNARKNDKEKKIWDEKRKENENETKKRKGNEDETRKREGGEMKSNGDETDKKETKQVIRNEKGTKRL